MRGRAGGGRQAWAAAAAAWKTRFVGRSGESGRRRGWARLWRRARAPAIRRSSGVRRGAPSGPSAASAARLPRCEARKADSWRRRHVSACTASRASSRMPPSSSSAPAASAAAAAAPGGASGAERLRLTSATLSASCSSGHAGPPAQSEVPALLSVSTLVASDAAAPSLQPPPHMTASTSASCSCASCWGWNAWPLPPPDSLHRGRGATRFKLRLLVCCLEAWGPLERSGRVWLVAGDACKAWAQHGTGSTCVLPHRWMNKRKLSDQILERPWTAPAESAVTVGRSRAPGHVPPPATARRIAQLPTDKNASSTTRRRPSSPGVEAGQQAVRRQQQQHDVAHPQRAARPPRQLAQL